MTILEFAKLPYIEGFDLDMYTLTFRDIKYNLVEYCDSRWLREIENKFDNNWDSTECTVFSKTYREYLDNWADLREDNEFITELNKKFGKFLEEDISIKGETLTIKHFDQYLSRHNLRMGLELVKINIEHKAILCGIDEMVNKDIIPEIYYVR